MTSFIVTVLVCSTLLLSSVLCQLDGDMLNKAQFAMGLGKRSFDDDNFSRAQIPMGFGKRSAPMDDEPAGRYGRYFVIGRRGEEAVRLPSGSRLFLLH